MQVLSMYSGFLPQSTDTQVRLIGDPKVPACINVWACVPPAASVCKISGDKWWWWEGVSVPHHKKVEGIFSLGYDINSTKTQYFALLCCAEMPAWVFCHFCCTISVFTQFKSWFMFLPDKDNETIWWKKLECVVYSGFFSFSLHFWCIPLHSDTTSSETVVGILEPQPPWLSLLLLTVKAVLYTVYWLLGVFLCH